MSLKLCPTQTGSLLQEVERRAWESQHLVTGAPTRKARRPGTAAYYSQCIARIVETWPQLVTVHPDHITREHCAQWFTLFQKMFCPEACNGALIVLRAAFAIARRRELIADDPTQDLQRAMIPDREWTAPDAQQWQTALEAMRAYVAGRKQKHRRTIHQLYLARWLAATGMRPAAAVALTVGDVDLERATVRLAGEHAKNGKTAVLPLGKAAMEVAREAAAASKEPGAGSREQGARLFLTKSARGVLRAASDAVGIKINHRTLRKMFATRALEAGVPVAMAARLLTHQDGGQTLLKHYAVWRDEALRAAVARMEST